MRDHDTDSALRRRHEIEHGRALAALDPEREWGWGGAAGSARARRRAGLLAASARLRPGSRVLEVGCGTGLFTALLSASGADILAIDVSPDLLACARRRGLPGNVRLMQTALEDLRVPSAGPFDAIVGSSVLHHLDPESVPALLKSLVAPAGCVSFAEPNLLNPQVFLERRLRRWRPFSRYVSPDETAILRWRFARALRRAGFGQVSIEPFDWLHPWVPGALVRPAETVGRVLEHVPLLREFAGSLLISAR